MPTKRELIGNDSPPDELRWSDFQWNRILAFFGGLSITVLYPWIDSFQHLPEWTAAGLLSISFGAILYGFSEQSWQRCLSITVGIEIVNRFVIYMDSIGIHIL